MDPQYEQRLRDEVIYLHSLWHQGPPRASSTAAAAASRHHLQPVNATQFKKVRNRGARNKKNTVNNSDTAAPEPISSPGIEWKCPTPPPPASTSGGWPNLAAKPDPNPLPFSPEDQLKSAARRAHHHAIRAVHEFFRSNSDGDSDSVDSSSDEDNDGGDDSMDEDCGRGEYSFFFNLFKEDAELRDYYSKNFAKGEFSCLVCGAVGGKKMGKKYAGCLPLVQHSISIGKTKKKKKAHKAFALAVCKVLSWDIDRLPAIVSSLSDKPREAEEGNGKNNVDSVEGKNDNADQESGLVGTGNLSNGDDGHMNSLTCPSPEWKLPTPPLAEAASGWPSWKAKTDPKPIPISPEDQLISAARHAHQNAINVVRDFFRCNNNDDDSDAMDCSSDEDDDDDDSSNEDDDARDEYNFFFKVFKEDAELRECYEKNFAKGEFSCLVCGAIGGKKMGKKYTGCLALVQHSIAAGKTKKKRAHKAFALAVCKVLSWDIDQLQTVASLLSDKSGETQGNSDNKESSRTVDNLDSIEGKNDNAVQESVPVDTEILSNNDDGYMNSLTCPDATKKSEEISKWEEPAAAEGLASNSLTCPDTGVVHPNNGEEPAVEGLASNSSACPDVDKNLENLGMVHPDNVEEPASEELVVVPLHENTSVVDEMPDLQTGNAILTELNKGDEI